MFVMSCNTEVNINEAPRARNCAVHPTVWHDVSGLHLPK